MPPIKSVIARNTRRFDSSDSLLGSGGGANGKSSLPNVGVSQGQAAVSSADMRHLLAAVPVSATSGHHDPSAEPPPLSSHFRPAPLPRPNPVIGYENWQIEYYVSG